jgi:antirestriction protein ArdC
MTAAVSFDDLANAIKQQLAGPLDEWVMPWHNGVAEPYNPVSGHTYTGNNAVSLIIAGQSAGYKSQQWATLRAWSMKGVKVQKGAVSTKIHVPIFSRSTSPIKNDIKRKSGFRTLSVFNGDQIASYNEDHPDLFDQFQNKQSLEEFIKQCKATINFHNGNAYYVCQRDNIFMPHKANFFASKHAPAEHNYYATIVHELIHWTGHPERLNRPTLGSAIHEDRALEELIAELGTGLICARFDNQIQPRSDHAAYLKFWLQGLDEEYYFGNAFKQAQEAIHYLYQLADSDIHPLSYSPVKENNEAPKTPEDEAPQCEQATPEARQYAAFEKIQTPPQSFVRNIRIKTQCLICNANYSVTLMRYETVSICPGCYAGNHHRLVW